MSYMSALCMTHVSSCTTLSLSHFLIVAMLAFFSFLKDFKLAAILGILTELL